MPFSDAEQFEAVLLIDADGTVYAVPRSVVEHWRVPAEIAVALRQGQEVTGYNVTSSNVDLLGTARLPQTFTPDLTAPAPPAGPVPVPYPNES